jgi:hypothetical protein
MIAFVNDHLHQPCQYKIVLSLSRIIMFRDAYHYHPVQFQIQLNFLMFMIFQDILQYYLSQLQILFILMKNTALHRLPQL